jgi:hypothetical protein
MTYHPPGHIPDDPVNPYAPPQSEVGQELPRLTGLSPTRFDAGEVASRAWRIYKPQMGLCIGVVIGSGAINYAANLMFQGLVGGMQAANVSPALLVLVFFVGFIGLMLFQFWLSVGINVFLLNLAGGRKAAFGDLFSGGPYLLATIVSSIILFLVIGGIIALGLLPFGLAALAARDNQGAVVGALLLGVAVASVGVILVTIRLSQFQYLIIDRGAGALESLQLSMQVTRGNGLQLFLLWLLAFVFNVAGLLACFVGLFFTAPYTYLMLAVAYYAMTGQPVADPGAVVLPELKPLAPQDPLS